MILSKQLRENLMQIDKRFYLPLTFQYVIKCMLDIPSSKITCHGLKALMCCFIISKASEAHTRVSLCSLVSNSKVLS